MRFNKNMFEMICYMEICKIVLGLQKHKTLDASKYNQLTLDSFEYFGIKPFTKIEDVEIGMKIVQDKAKHMHFYKKPKFVEKATKKIDSDNNKIQQKRLQQFKEAKSLERDQNNGKDKN